MSSSDGEYKMQGNEKTARLMALNNLDYNQADETVLVIHRSLVSTNFSKTSYKARTENATCFLNYGGTYIDPLRGYLMMDITVKDNVESATAATLKCSFGSALNCIDEITLTTRNGLTVERVQKPNIRQFHVIPWTKGTNQVNRYSSFQYELGSTNTFDYSDAVATNNHTVCIPLTELGLGIFNNVGNKLLPPKLMSGMKIEISFADNWFAFQHSADGSAKTNDYTINNMKMVMDSVNINHGVRHILNMQASSKQGMPLRWKSWDLTQSSVVGGTAVNISHRYPRSLATKGIVILTRTPDDAKSQTTDNQLISHQTKWVDQQFRYADKYYPHAKLTQSASGSEMEFYMNTLQNIADGYDTSVHFGQFDDSVENQTVFCSKPAAVNLENVREADLNGVAVSSGKSLDFNGTVAVSSNFNVWFFVEYMVQCHVFSDVIKIDT